MKNNFFNNGAIHYDKVFFDHGCYIKFEGGYAKNQNDDHLASDKEQLAIYMPDEIFDLIETDINRQMKTWAHYEVTEITSKDWRVLRIQYQKILEKIKPSIPKHEIARHLEGIQIPKDHIDLIINHRLEMDVFLKKIIAWADKAIERYGAFTIYGM